MSFAYISNVSKGMSSYCDRGACSKFHGGLDPTTTAADDIAQMLNMIVVKKSVLCSKLLSKLCAIVKPWYSNNIVNLNKKKRKRFKNFCNTNL